MSDLDFLIIITLAMHFFSVFYRSAFSIRYLFPCHQTFIFFKLQKKNHLICAVASICLRDIVSMLYDFTLGKLNGWCFFVYLILASFSAALFVTFRLLREVFMNITWKMRSGIQEGNKRQRETDETSVRKEHIHEFSA